MTNAMTDRFAHFFTSPRRPVTTVSFAQECTDPDVCYPTDTGEDDLTDPKGSHQQSGIGGSTAVGVSGVTEGGIGSDSVLFRVRRLLVDSVRLPALVAAG